MPMPASVGERSREHAGQDHPDLHGFHGDQRHRVLLRLADTNALGAIGLLNEAFATPPGSTITPPEAATGLTASTPSGLTADLPALTGSLGPSALSPLRASAMGPIS